MDRFEYHYIAKYSAYAYKKSQARTRKFVSEIFKLKKGVDKCPITPVSQGYI